MDCHLWPCDHLVGLIWHNGMVAGAPRAWPQCYPPWQVSRSPWSLNMAERSLGHSSAWLLRERTATGTSLPPSPPPLTSCFCSQGHEKCALLLLGETQDLGLINATNSALQM